MTIEERLARFLERGYRPTVKTHIFMYKRELEEQGWLVWRWRDIFGQDQVDLLGWVVDAYPTDERTRVFGATCKTLDEAITYAESEMEKYA